MAGEEKGMDCFEISAALVAKYEKEALRGGVQGPAVSDIP